MAAITAARTIIVRQRPLDGWVMVTPRARSEIRFQSRQRALQFARAYAKLNGPVTLRVIGAAGEVEAEEVFEGALAARS
jgi:hypothetical protein